MATDNFTDTNGVHLLDHTVQMTWYSTYYVVNPDTVTINTNAVKADAFRGGAFASTSAVDSSQVKHLAAATLNGTVRACVRMPLDNLGYDASLTGASGGNWTSVSFYKNRTTLLGAITGLSYSQAADHTVKITAAQAGGPGTTITLEAFIDGSSVGTKTDTTSVIDSGKSGFYVNNSSGAAALIMMDDWTDGASDPATSKARRSLLGVGI